MPPKKRKNTAAQAKASKPTKKAKTEEPGPEEKTEETSEEKVNESESTTSEGSEMNRAGTIIASWNVNGIRAWLKKDGLKYMRERKPDILMLQETKCGLEDLPPELKTYKGYHTYFQSTDGKSGYAGVGLFSKEKPIKVDFGMGIEKHDGEGRLITAEYNKFYVIGAYVPNSGRGLVRLKYRQEWDVDFRAYMKKLDAKKPVIYTGDLNVAHKEIDLANPKSNTKNAGFTKEERDGFSQLLAEGFVDSFRHLYPEKKGAYSFWTFMGNARAKNVGWRLDYFVVSKRIVEKISDTTIDAAYMGSDHCPITLDLTI